MVPSTELMPAHCGGSASPYPRTSVLNVMSSGCRKSPAEAEARHALDRTAGITSSYTKMTMGTSCWLGMLHVM